MDLISLNSPDLCQTGEFAIVTVYKFCFVLSIRYIMPFCKHVVAKVIWFRVPLSKQLKRDSVGHGEVTMNNARIIQFVDSSKQFSYYSSDVYTD